MSYHLTPELRAEVERLLKRGHSVRTISNLTTVAKQTISTIRASLNMTTSHTVIPPARDVLMVELPMNHPQWSARPKCGKLGRDSYAVEAEALAKIGAALDGLTAVSRCMVLNLATEQVRDAAGDSAEALHHYAYLMDHVAKALTRKAAEVEAEIAALPADDEVQSAQPHTVA